VCQGELKLVLSDTEKRFRKIEKDIVQINVAITFIAKDLLGFDKAIGFTVNKRIGTLKKLAKKKR
jgi:hypothetical protein